MIVAHARSTMTIVSALFIVAKRVKAEGSLLTTKDSGTLARSAGRKAKQMTILPMTDEIAQLDREWPMGRALDLPPNSRVLFAGMYVGRAAELLHALYQPREVYGFDPQLWALQESANRGYRLNCDGITIGDHHNPAKYAELLAEIHKRKSQDGREDRPIWSLFNFAIGTEADHEKTLPMGEWETDGCSFVTNTRVMGEGRIYEIGGVLFDLGTVETADDVFDLAVFNMEGYEYPLLEHMDYTDTIGWFDRFVVQFHTQHGNAIPRDRIFDMMARHGYRVVIDDFPRWVFWSRVP